MVQRMVAVAKDQIGENWVELTSIQYGLSRAGGPVVALPHGDFSNLTENDILYITAHGQPGQAGEFTGDEIANFLLDKDTGLMTSIKAIIFTSCNAGVGVTDKKSHSDSVVRTLQNRLGAAGMYDIDISGALGPSIKHDEMGDDYDVLPVSGPKKDTASLAQKALEVIHDPSGQVTRALILARRKKGGPLTLEEKAKAASDATHCFFKRFMWALKNPEDFADEVEELVANNTLEKGKYGRLAEDLRNFAPLLAKASLIRVNSSMLGDDQVEIKPPKSLSKVGGSTPKGGSPPKGGGGAAKGGGNGDGGKCILTSAVLLSLMAPDDCYELTKLRQFRDGILSHMPGGRTLISRYYEVAPRIDAAIAARPEALQRYAGLMTHIQSAVQMVETGNFCGAYQHYATQLRLLEEEFLDASDLDGGEA